MLCLEAKMRLCHLLVRWCLQTQLIRCLQRHGLRQQRQALQPSQQLQARGRQARW